MIRDASPELQALLGTLMTWGLTAAGASVALFVSGDKRYVLDGSLGFAGGVMLAASYWSLLAPAIQMAEASGSYGRDGEYAFLPAAIGFVVGAGFVFFTDWLMSNVGVESPLAMLIDADLAKQPAECVGDLPQNACQIEMADGAGLRQRRHNPTVGNSEAASLAGHACFDTSGGKGKEAASRWRRMLLLIVAITVHNIPEGLAVGVGFGAAAHSDQASFENARNLAIGIGIQNFPEGLAVSLPLKAAGFPASKAIWYGQLSGLVEPLAGLLGAFLVSLMQPILPYALAFAAGAMVYVVVDDIIPEAQTCGNGKIASWGAIIGFLVMMCLDVGLG